MNLRRSPELDFEFGRPTGGHVPQATVSALFNVMTEALYDILVDRCGACERQLLIGHLEVLEPGDVLVLDRSYPSHEVLRELLDRGLDFLLRTSRTRSFGPR